MHRITGLFVGLLLACAPALANAEQHEGEATADAVATNDDSAVPFQRFWVKTDFALGDWTQVTVAPVNVEIVKEMEWWQTRAGGDLRPQDLQNLADYARQQFELAFRDGDNGDRVAFSAESGPNTLRLETAIVEVVPTKLLSSVTPGLPRGSVAIEGRIVDSVSGEVLAKFADRRTAKHRIVNLNVGWDSGAKEVIRSWASEIAQTINRGAGAAVNDSWNFTLRPW